MSHSLVLVHVAATLFMCGVIWFVQVAHYPLFAHVGPGAFPQFERRHTRLTTIVVAPAMLIEAGSAISLVWWAPPSIPLSRLVGGSALLAVIWLSTFLLQVPCHRALAAGFQVAVHRRLVRSNWIRTLAWSGRAAVVLAML